MSRHEGRPRGGGGLNIGGDRQVVDLGGNPMDDALGSVAGARGMVQTRTAYQTAITVQVPRDLSKVHRLVLDEAARAKEAFIYSWSQKDKNSDTGRSTIEGVSIDGAMILLRNWGNAACEPSITNETPTHWIFSATFIDLETGFTSTRLFRQRKSQSTGKMDQERSLDIQFQIGQSKAIRNVVTKCLPTWLIDDAIGAAKTSAAKRFENVAEWTPKVIAWYARQRTPVPVERLEKKVGRPSRTWTPQDLVFLDTIKNAVAEGMTTFESEFFQDEDEPETAPAATAVEAAPAATEAAPAPEASTLPAKAHDWTKAPPAPASAAAVVDAPSAEKPEPANIFAPPVTK